MLIQTRRSGTLNFFPPRYERGGDIGGLVYIHRISDVRFTGTAARSFKALLALCGEQALRNVVIVTNMWGRVTPEVGGAREQELASNFFKPALDKGAVLRRHHDTAESARTIIRDMLGRERVTLQIQEEIVDQWKRIEETAAGMELLRELDEQVDKRMRQLRELREMLNQTKADDEETRQELEQEVSKLHGELVALRSIPGGTLGSFRKTAKDVLFYGLLGAGCFLWVRTQ